MTDLKRQGRPAIPAEDVKDVRQSTMLTRETSARLRAAASHAGVTDSEIVRAAIEAELIRRGS